jgi:adenine-specific DNA-methyltransferase
MTDRQQLGMNLPTPQAVESVEQYQFEPIKGYPMLHWRGKRPFTSTQYYPAQLKEVHGAEVESWRSKIFWGDNLQVMSHLLKEFRGKVNLVYIDPPFDSKAEYRKRIELKGKAVSNDQNAFEDKQYKDIWTNDEYLQFMYERLVLMRELLSEQGSIYVHCDWHKEHHLRCIIEEIFGHNNFRSKLIWKRISAKNDSIQGAKGFPINYDVILLYSKTEDFCWRQLYTDLDEEYKQNFYKYVESETGRRYRLGDLTAPGRGTRGHPEYEFLGVKRFWRYNKEKMDKLYTEGKIVQAKPGGVPAIKRYLDESQGQPVQTIWIDIPPVQGQSNERFNYPTQKPEALLERIIKASSNPGDIVFDCFMGSGTTQAVAMKLGRRFIGADINLGAVQITTKRLLGVAEEIAQAQEKSAKVVQLPIPQAVPATGRRAAESEGAYNADDETALDEAGEAAVGQNAEPTTYYTGFEVYNVNHYDVFRNPLEAKDLLLEALEVNRLEQGNFFDGEKDGRMVKIMPINRIATRADLNELIAGFDYKAFERRQQEHPYKPVEKLTLVCMGHEPDLAAQLKKEVKPFELDVEVVDILRDKSNLEFKRDSEAQITVQRQTLVIERFYPMNLLQKLSLQQENVDDWRELVESVMIDWNFDGAILEPKLVDIPDKNELVKGSYPIPDDAGTIRVKITDLLSESLEVEIETDD